MIANLVSYFVSKKIQSETLYEELARQDGIHLPVAGSRVRPDARLVGQVMHQPEEVLAASMTVEEACALAQRSGLSTWPVVDEQGLFGLIATETLRQMKEEGKGGMRLAEAIGSINFPHLHSDQSLDIALERMGVSGSRLLPVVSRFNAREMLGVVYLSDILNAYRVAIQEPDHPAVVQTAAQTESETAT